MDRERGIGWYEVDSLEQDCSSSGSFEYDEPFNPDRLAGYVGVSGGFGRWFVMGLRAHMTNSGKVSGFGTGTGELTGPIYPLNVGLTWDGG